ncbi:sulfotransferase family 2 domain-containing protein [Rhodosalinus sp. K401]|uniref:sulfotransferase family 2 domain-containing protein n=1 Tax=Rhodosalinus sp. K401 TaxID=3239195 RepID=UPI003526A26E
MIISPGRAYVFVHIPKTGGTSLALALEARAMRDDILIGDTPKARRRKRRLDGVRTRGRLWKHATLADIDGLVSVQDLDRLFAFTLVRNPWDRLVSYYCWLRAQRFDHEAVRLARKLEFAAFLAHPHTQASLRAAPYGHYMTDARGRERADLYIRLERFEEDAAPLFAHLGVRIDLPRVNASDRDRDWRGYYSDETAALVGDLCAGDIRRFGYAFDG